MGKSGGCAAKKIKDEIPDRSQTVLHIISKDIERPHIPQNVPEAAMEEHIRNQTEQLLAKGEISRHMGNRVAGWYQAVCIHKSIKPRAQRRKPV